MISPKEVFDNCQIAYLNKPIEEVVHIAMKQYANVCIKAYQEWLNKEGYGFFGNYLHEKTNEELIALFRKSLKQK